MNKVIRLIISSFFVFCSTFVLTLVLFNVFTASDRRDANFGDLTRGIFYLACIISFGINIFLMWALQVFIRRTSKVKLPTED